MKIIFLDIDGVIINTNSVRQGRQKLVENIQPCVQALNRITDETGAKIVISSSWRHRFPSLLTPLEILKEINSRPSRIEKISASFKRWGITGEVIDMTPDLSSEKTGVMVERGTEIANWLKWFRKRTICNSFVIIDDEDDMGALKPKLVRTVFDDGLTDAKAQECIEILNVTGW